MLLDPCSASLVPGFSTTSEGMLSSLRSVLQMGTDQANGYVVWFPDYATDGDYFPNNSDYAVHTANCFTFTTDIASAHPSNTIDDPYGSNGAAQGYKRRVGATAFLRSSTVSDLRELSSCIQAVYTDTTLQSKGLITPINNLSPDAILAGGAGGKPASVSEIFAMMQDVRRVGLNVHSVRSRPNPSVADSWMQEQSTPILVGISGTHETVIPKHVEAIGPSCIGFAWTGIPTDTLHFTFTQNIEWRPDVSAGFRVTVPKQINGPNVIPNILRRLDRFIPGWASLAEDAMQKAIYAFLNGYANGARRHLH